MTSLQYLLLCLKESYCPPQLLATNVNEIFKVLVKLKKSIQNSQRIFEEALYKMEKIWKIFDFPVHRLSTATCNIVLFN